MILAQLTDLHIKPAGRLAYRQVDTAACLEAAIGDLMTLPVPADVVLVTGDLTDAGLPEEYRLLRQLLSPLPLPIFLMPGNHDARAALRDAFPDHAYLGTGDGPVHYVIEDFPVRIVALDSLIPGESGGRLGEDQLAWLEARLAEQPARPTVVAVHHPPFLTGIGHMDLIGLEDGAGLAGVVRKHPHVERVLCGHVHRSIQVRWGGTIASAAPSTAHQIALDLRADAPPQFFLEPAGYHLHRFTPETGTLTYTRPIGPWPGPYPFFDGGVLLD